MCTILLKLQLPAWDETEFSSVFTRESLSYRYFNENPVYIRANFKLLKLISCATAIDDRLTPVHPSYGQQSGVTGTLIIATVLESEWTLRLTILSATHISLQEQFEPIFNRAICNGKVSWFNRLSTPQNGLLKMCPNCCEVSRPTVTLEDIT